MSYGASRPRAYIFLNQANDVVSWHTAEVGDSPRLMLLPPPKKKSFLQVVEKGHWLQMVYTV